MSARNAIIFAIVLAILLPFYLLVDRRQTGPTLQHQKEESLLKLDGIDALTIIRGSESIRFQKTPDGKLYQVVEPVHAFLPQDMMVAMSKLLIDMTQVEIISNSSSDLSEYGLDHPQFVMLIQPSGGGHEIKLIVGAENPTRTSSYAQVVGNPKIFLVGSNVEYYQSLMFEWAEGKMGKNPKS